MVDEQLNVKNEEAEDIGLATEVKKSIEMYACDSEIQCLMGLNSGLSRFNKMQVFKSIDGVLPYEKAGVTRTEYSALVALHDIGESTMTDVARCCGFTASRTTRAIESLVKGGFATRTIKDDNRRAIYVATTEKGYDLTEKNNEAVLYNFHNVMKNVPKQEMYILIKAYSTILDIYEKYCNYPKTVADFKKE
ncbi:MAG: MarR family transcriptional regulator [Clostridia bacterium]